MWRKIEGGAEFHKVRMTRTAVRVLGHACNTVLVWPYILVGTSASLCVPAAEASGAKAAQVAAVVEVAAAVEVAAVAATVAATMARAAAVRAAAVQAVLGQR